MAPSGAYRASNGGRRVRLIMASNRGPVEHRLDEESGRIERRWNGGGVATALASLNVDLPLTWIASAGSRADRMLARRGERSDIEGRLQLRLVEPPPDAYDIFYGQFCNPLLWFLQHDLWSELEREPSEREIVRAWERGYLPVNQLFAEAIVEEMEREDGPSRIMLHDYHFYAVPLFIRNRKPNAALQQFVHIPWPGPQAWRRLPAQIVASICAGMLANDSVVFQTEQSAEHFALTCQMFLRGVQVSASGQRIAYGGRRTRVWHNPVSVNFWDLRSQLMSDSAERYRRKLSREAGERTIVRVDRLDPSKNVAAGFRAYGRLLEEHPEWRGSTRFLAFLVPSRGGIPEYRSYAEDVFAEVARINERFGTAEWTPVKVFHEHNRPQALVALSMYDVLLVNPLIDGMNLVSKEGPVLNERDGVLVLSETAGSFEELRDGAIAARPLDVQHTADALHRALEMPADERRERARTLREAVLRHGLRRWVRLLLQDLESIAVPMGNGAATANGGAHAAALRQARG